MGVPTRRTVDGEHCVRVRLIFANFSSHDYFMDIANMTDVNSPYHLAGVPFSVKSTQSTARRLRRTRQHIGSYRHDLMVAMRVVNNVEREMMKAEWENWLLDENNRCRQVQAMLQEEGGKGDAKVKGWQKALGAEPRERGDELRTWHDEYCGSCRLEQDRLMNGTGSMPFV